VERRKKIIVKNNFHNTETYVLAYGNGKRWFINKRQYCRMWRKLCGIKGCLCSLDVTFNCIPGYIANINEYEVVIGE